ncbi:MAG TPA: hypothetical protein VGO22_23825 [Pseudorhizobium sp.]|jgi:hypothetical protein|nr:hypothetical protein [Pseudorhizobium sp.]
MIAKDVAALGVILGILPRTLIRETNRQVVDYAVNYVYGVDDLQLPFVSKHFVTKEQPRLLESAARQQADVTARMLEILEEPSSSS